jgi:hypothetical protein
VSTGDWVLVSAAVLLTGATAGVLLTLPLWTDGRPRRLVPTLLSAHAGIVAVVGAVTAAAAVRSWQLVDRAPDRPVAATLLDVSRIDGDASMFALLVLGLVFGTVLAVVALALAARFASGDDPVERMVACGVLALEICIGGYGAARLLHGSHGAAVLLIAVHLPLAMLAMVRCWPPAEPA